MNPYTILFIVMVVLLLVLFFIRQKRENVPTAKKFRNLGVIILGVIGVAFFLMILLFIYAWSFV